MRNLTRFVFVLSLAACKTETINQVDCNEVPDDPQCQDDPCIEDPGLPECQTGDVCIDDLDCTQLDTADGCFEGFCSDERGVCEVLDRCGGQGSAEAVVFMSSLDQAFVGIDFDTSPTMNEYLEQEESFHDIAKGECAEVTRSSISGAPDRQTFGTVEILLDGTAIASLDPDQDGRYEESLPAGLFTGGDKLAFRTSGSPVLAATTFARGFLPILSSLPNMTGTFDANNVLQVTSPTFTFDAIVADEMIIGFQFLSGGNVIEFQCRGDLASNSFTMANDLFARLPGSGSINFRAFNQRFRKLATADGQDRWMRSLVQAGGNVQFQKP